jgi:hypothetical protein
MRRASAFALGEVEHLESLMIELASGPANARNRKIALA